MPTLNEIHREISKKEAEKGTAFVRKRYIQKLFKYTSRPVILYASAFDVKGRDNLPFMIMRNDIQGFMSALSGIEGNEVDLILHSPGGQAEATEQIVNYLRQKFAHIRVIIPQNAMSAATMLACAADVIVMGKHSALGPIDPQINFGGISVPAQSILDEFALAQQSIAQGAPPIVWAGRVSQYPAGFLVQCSKVIELSKVLVREWLEGNMFRNEPTAKAKAAEIAEWLGDNSHFLTHGRSIGIQEAKARGLKIEALEDDQELQEGVLSVFHATIATFQRTECFKLFENHRGKGSYLLAQANTKP